jgi:hypothetical protein
LAQRVIKHVHIHQDMAAPAERVFAALDDHENMGEWLGSSVSLIKNVGTHDVGSVRRIQVGMLRIDEEIVARAAPRVIAYRVIRGVPMLRHHHGEVTIEAAGDTSHVHWHVEIDSNVPGFSFLMALALRGTLGRGLKRLDRQLAR